MLSTTDKILFLRRSSLFAEMSLEQIRVLTSHLEEQHFLPGEVIMYEGEFSQELYILVSGRVRIAKDYRGPHEQTLALVRATLDTASFDAAFVEGQAMSMDEVVAYTLSE